MDLFGFRWIIQDKLAGSGQPGQYNDLSKDTNLLKKHEIDTIVNLRYSKLYYDELEPDFELVNFPITDMNIPLPRKALELVQIMDEKINKGQKLLIHCKAGLGRTGLIAASYLIYKGMDAEESLRHIRTINPSYVQNKLQENFLMHFGQFVASLNEE
ncbi:MAG: dual specificity protein phosphatase family protein [Cyclobacteriaceae bacterium]|nr:dual specificity protein phosphatase family protein [Cyclobacteriaceae bacterium]